MTTVLTSEEQQRHPEKATSEAEVTSAVIYRVDRIWHRKKCKLCAKSTIPEIWRVPRVSTANNPSID